MNELCKYLKDDINGNPIHVGDTVISDGNETVIGYGVHREIYGFGSVFGYYIPDVCEVVKKWNDK